MTPYFHHIGEILRCAQNDTCSLWRGAFNDFVNDFVRAGFSGRHNSLGTVRYRTPKLRRAISARDRTIGCTMPSAQRTQNGIPAKGKKITFRRKIDPPIRKDYP